MARRQNTGAAVSQALEAVEEPGSRRVLQQARRTEAVSMALAGLTYEQIGNRLGISQTAAIELVRRTLEETRNHDVDALRQVENARLDRAQAAIWSNVLEGDLKAIGTYLRIAERRAKLNGLDAPTKVQMTLSVRQEMEQALAALEDILDAEVVEDGQEEADVVTLEERQATSHEYHLDVMPHTNGVGHGY